MRELVVRAHHHRAGLGDADAAAAARLLAGEVHNPALDDVVARSATGRHQLNAIP
ncbi:MAG: hypothetical protein JWP29_2038, partial [Rhodoferax sp.]|nr:hypothetical protein [Rhodoferax sp.]